MNTAYSHAINIYIHIKKGFLLDNHDYYHRQTDVIKLPILIGFWSMFSYRKYYGSEIIWNF